MSKPLHIPPSKKVPGLHIYCARCDTIVSDRCKLADLPLDKCKHGDKHRFKGIVYVEGNKRKTKTFGRDYTQAVAGIAHMRNQLQESSEPKPVAQPQDVPAHRFDTDNGKTNLLMPLLAKYVGFLHGDETVPIFKRKVRSQGHIADVERTFLRFAKAAKATGRNVKELRIDAIDDTLIGAFYTHLTKELELGNAGYNRAITIMSSFFIHLIEQEGYTIKNPFIGIIRRPLKVNVKTIGAEEFAKLLAVIKDPSIGTHTLKTGQRKNYYRPFMRDALELLLYSGRRRSEAVLMKWQDIVYDDAGSASYITVPDYKVNRAKQLAKPDWQYNYVPVTAELAELLTRLGEADNRHTDRYILAPDESMSRASMASLISKSFAQYAKHIGLDLSLGSLRRTNFSSLAAAIGMENARTVTGHAGLAVMKKHYISKRVLAKTAQEFSVFENEKQKDRQRDIETLRKEDTEQSHER